MLVRWIDPENSYLPISVVDQVNLAIIHGAAVTAGRPIGYPLALTFQVNEDQPRWVAGSFVFECDDA